MRLSPFVSFFPCPLTLNKKLLYYYNYRPSNSVKGDAGVKNTSQQIPAAKPRTAKHDTRRTSASQTLSNGVVVISNAPRASAPRSNAHTMTSSNNYRPAQSIQAQPAVTVEYGGFSEEDESEDRQAALSSPIKGKQVMSSSVSIGLSSFQDVALIRLQNLVKIEEPTHQGRKEKFTNVNLPTGSQDSWRTAVIPRYYLYIGSRDDIWSISDHVAIDLLQKIWDYVYGARIPHIVASPGAVTYIVSLLLSSVQ